jgi:sterol desaturase/sphingolipid hydroxylase (fatty acid hydroxylase superfamily)
MNTYITKVLGDIGDWLVFLFTSPGSSAYWLYFAGAFVLAALVYWMRDHQPGPRSLARLWFYCFPRDIYLKKGAFHDVSMFFINSALFSLFLGSMMLASLLVSTAVWKALYYGLGEPSSFAGVDTVNQLVLMMFVLLAIDLAFFISHYLHHKLPILWEFHKIHHSATRLNPFTVYRRHPVDLLIEGNISGLTAGLVFGVSDYLSNGKLDMWTSMGVNAAMFAFMLTIAHLQHMHIWISFGDRLNRLLVCPAMHQIHHSKDPRHLDRNMGNILSVWDWLAGTLYLPGRREELVFGLAGGEENRLARLPMLYFEPFMAAARLIGRWQRLFRSSP